MKAYTESFDAAHAPPDQVSIPTPVGLEFVQVEVVNGRFHACLVNYPSITGTGPTKESAVLEAKALALVMLEPRGPR